MAKGVKKIRCINERNVYPDMSVPNVRLTIKPNEWVWFMVSEWESGTTEKDKERELTWLLQNADRNIILNEKKTVSMGSYGIVIPKKLCGSHYYYVEASLFGSRDFRRQAGLYVRGYCPPKIVSSKWCKFYNGDDERKTYQFSYGENIYLYLATEGLNGDKVNIEIYRQKQGGRGTMDDELIRVITNVQVIDGEVNLEIGNSYLWLGSTGKPKNEEKFYIKVKTIEGAYITDGKDDEHARYLRIKNNVVSKKIETPTNITPVKVGQVDKNKKNIHLCAFKSIIIDDNGENFLIFKEGVTSFEKVVPKTQFANLAVHFDLDKSDLNSETKAILTEVSNFLLRNQHLEMLLSGHTDDRGSLEYNQKLSERRTQTVFEYFVSKGLDKNKIKIRNFGEARPNKVGLTEEAYKKNRRVEINFSYIEYNQNAIVYETLAGGNSRNIIVNVNGYSAGKACFRKEKHKKKIIADGIIKTGNSISHPISYYLQKDFPKNYGSLLLSFLNPLSIIYRPYPFYINSCAYYADKDKATLEVRTYPDVVWIAHFQYNYQDSGTYFFHNKTFDDLSVGITDVLNELQQTIFYKIWRVLPSNFIYEHTVLKYIEEQAKYFVYGLHTIHNRNIEKAGQELSLQGTKTNMITQTSYVKYMAAIAIYEFVVIGILIDLLLIYLTRGRNLGNRVKTISKMARNGKAVLKKLDDIGVELIPPSIAINAGMYYQKQANGKVALIYEVNLKAAPILAVNFKREFNLLELLQKGREIKNAKYPKANENNENNRLIVENLKEKNESNIIGIIEIRGDLIFEDNVSYNTLTNTYTFDEKVQNLKTTAKNERTLTQKITFSAEIKGKMDAEFIFTKIEAEVGADINGEASLKLKYGLNEKENKGFFVDLSLHCSGIKGSYWGKLKVTSRSIGGLFNKSKYVPFTLIEGFDLPISKVELFKSQT